MKTKKIYLSGAMGNLTLEEQLSWRFDFINAIKTCDCTYSPIYFNPPTKYSPALKAHKTEREAFEYDLAELRTSDLVVVNFNDPKSIGTAMELILAKELHIPVIGLNADNKELHPWLEECCTRICDSWGELIEHIVEFYLN